LKETNSACLVLKEKGEGTISKVDAKHPDHFREKARGNYKPFHD